MYKMNPKEPYARAEIKQMPCSAASFVLFSIAAKKIIARAKHSDLGVEMRGGEREYKLCVHHMFVFGFVFVG